MTVRLLDASEVARILGTSRQIVAQLSATEPDFPPAVDDPNRGRRRWDRRAVEIWAASQPDMVWGWSPPKLAWPGQLYDHQIMSVAGSEADSLNHDFLGDVHLLLALLHPGCPGGAREALESFGLRLAEARQSVADELGHPETPRRHGRTLARGISVLERAHLKAIELRDEEVSSEHVLLALLDAWESTPAKPFLERDGVERTALAERVITLTESGSSVARDPAPSTVSRRLIHAAEVAGVLGVSRARVAELAAGRGFPDSELDRHGHRCWERRAIFQWAVAHPERGPLRKPLEPPAPAHMPARLDEIFRIASAEAEQLNHHWVGRDHLLLALLHPDCPGLARTVLEAFGVSLDQIRQEWTAGLGDPFEPHDRALVVPPGTNHVLTRAKVNAAELEDDEVAGEHVLLALTDEWPGAHPDALIAERGGDAASLRERLISVTDGMLPAPEPPPPRAWPPTAPKRVRRPPEPELAPSPLGHDPRRRKPWGSAVFGTPEGKAFTQGRWLRQYFIDRDGYPVLTTDGQPIHTLIDEEGRPVLDEDGRQIVTVVDVPPAARVRAYPQD